MGHVDLLPQESQALNDLLFETVIPLGEVPALVPLRPAMGTVYRWAQSGVGGVVLETAKVGGKVVTSKEAVRRFLAALNPGPRPVPQKPAPARERSARSLARAGAEARLQKKLGVTAGEPNAPGGRWESAQPGEAAGHSNRTRPRGHAARPPSTLPADDQRDSSPENSSD